MEKTGNSSSSSTTVNSGDTIKILIATDCHLGYHESDRNIGHDSFTTFEEILIMAVENDVDMILLGGDLFHHNNPSQQTLNRCMSLLRQYTMGDKEVFLELLCNAPMVVPEGSAPVNYLDKNLNVSIPVFSIHGNHDDPSGVGLCSTMDTLSSAGLINYFGKWTDLSRIEIRPILLKKGATRLALYGLSHIKDERLSRLFLEEKVLMVRPEENRDDWFNLFVLHQNRVDRGPKRFISESYLPGFLDFVVWGHEHDCDIKLEKNDEKGFFVTQPGSSVPTSLSEGEARPKHVGLLQVQKRQFKFEELRLHTTRPFVFDVMRLMDLQTSSSVRGVKSEEIRAACEARVESLLEQSKELITGHPKQPKLPLVRLRCDYNDESQLFNLVKFGQIFYQRVANPDTEVIRLKKLAVHREKDYKDALADLGKLQEMNEESPENFSSCVESIVDEYFETHAEKRLLVLSHTGMACGVERTINKEDAGAIGDVCHHQRSATLRKMLELDVTEDNVVEHLERLRDERCASAQELDQELKQMFNSRVASSRSGRDLPEIYLPSDDEADEVYPAPAPAPKRGQKKTTTTPAMFAANSSRNGSSDPDVDQDDWDVPAPTRGRGRGRGSRGARVTAPRARGTRAPRATRAAAPKPAKAPLFPPTPTRSTPLRAAAAQSQVLMSINYDDDDSN